MFYRENGQYKTSYHADQQVFPIAQDRWAILLLVAAAFLVVPMVGTDYMFRAIIIPFSRKCPPRCAPMPFFSAIMLPFHCLSG